MRKNKRGGAYQKMRILRVFVALAVFMAISAQFLDVYHKLPDAYYYVHPASIQFAPSLLSMLATGAVLSGAAFIAFTVAALLFGRAYCSFFCPFGILMDIVGRIAKFPSNVGFLKKTSFGAFCKKHFASLKFAKARNLMRTFFTVFAAVLIAFGFTALLGLFEPYSLYGKIMGAAAHIGVSSFFGALSAFLSDNGIYSVPPINGNVAVAFAAFGFSIAVLLVIVAVSALRGRLFCNTVCPVGGFLGLVSRFSVFRMVIGESKCVACGRCERECKAQCIDAKNKSLDFSRCVMCFDCSGTCTQSAIKLGLNPIYGRAGRGAVSHGGAVEKSESKSRRGFVKLAPALAAFFCFGAKTEEKPDPEYKIIEGAIGRGLKGHRADKRLTVPAGAKSLKNFAEHCTGCQICVSACPTQILKPAIAEWGLAGFMQPYMDFDAGFCVHACRDCSLVCPTGAITAISEPEKLTAKIGTAVFKEHLCVVYTDGTDCAACAEHCPVSAIEMIPFKPEKSLYIPHVHSDVCIGCGACEHICPVLENKAIVVQGLAVHGRAKVFEQSMRLYVPQSKAEGAAKEAPAQLDNPFPF